MAAPEVLADLTWCDVPVTLWRWPDTGFSVVLARSTGPITHGFFCIATEAHDDDGLPHTLEHLIFLGSEQYPFKGVLDTAANRLFARGTNAWTATDHTAYTACHAGADGLLTLLPVYADHVLFPTLTEAGFTTEVYHVNGEGLDAGVVYCEMEARENSSYSVTSYELHRMCFPTSGYRSETGGRMRELRESCTHAKVVAYHRQMYRPSGVRLIVVGDVPADRLLATCETIQQRILTKGLDHWPRDVPPCWTQPAPSLSETLTSHVRFPSDDEETGIVRVGWLTFGVNQQYERSAMEVLLTYLTDTSVAELQQAFVECVPPLAGAVYASADDYDPQMVTITCDSVPTGNLDVICSTLADMLTCFASSDGAALDAERMRSVLQRRRLGIFDAAESSPEASISSAVIPAFLYSRSKDEGEALRVALAEMERIDRFEKEPASFWTQLAHTALATAPRMQVIGMPSSQLSKDNAAADAARVEARKQALGPDGLRSMHDSLEAAKAVNETPMPADMLDAFPVPPVENISTHAVVTLRSAVTASAPGEAPLPPPPKELHLAAQQVGALPLAAQFDHLASTRFVDIELLVRIDGVDPDMLSLLPTLCASLFESPVKRGVELVPHAQVVAQLSAATTHVGAALGFGGSRFSVGAFGAGCIVLSARCEAAKYEATARLMCECLLNSQPSAERLRVLVQKSLNSVPRTSRDGGACASALLRSRMCAPNTIARDVLFPAQQRTLTSLLHRLETEPEAVCDQFATLRATLVAHPSRLMLHVGGALTRLGVDDLSSVWLQHLVTGLNPTNEVHAKCSGRITLGATCLLASSQHNGWARVVANGAVDSGYLTVSGDGPDHWEHADVAPLMVAIELLTQLEGPFWKELRGAGLSYSYSISLNPEEGRVFFSLFKAGHVGSALRCAASIVAKYAADADGTLFDARSVETAVSSGIYSALNRERTPASASRAALISYLRSVPPDGATRRLLAALRAVSPQSVRQALRTYLVPLFDPASTVTAACVHPNKVEDLLKDAAHYKFAALASMDEAWGAAETEAPCMLAAQRGRVDADGAKCACPRCVPKPGKGPFVLRS